MKKAKKKSNFLLSIDKLLIELSKSSIGLIILEKHEKIEDLVISIKI